MIRTTLLCLVALLLAGGFSSEASAQATKKQKKKTQESKIKELKVGDEAPDWKLPGSDGKTYQLSKFKGKSAVVVAWYPMAHTGG